MSSFDSVEFLSLRMFPGKLVNQARLEISDGKFRNDVEAYIEKVNIYERALRALSDESLMAMVEDERQQDAALLQEREDQLDRHRFFNEPEASANFVRWAKRPCWTLDEVTALILGKNPEVVKGPAENEEEPAGDGPTTLLKMTIAMAVGRYGFDPDSGRNSTITDIVRDLEKVDLSLSPATIRKWLREASACLPDGVDQEAGNLLGQQQG